MFGKKDERAEEHIQYLRMRLRKYAVLVKELKEEKDRLSSELERCKEEKKEILKERWEIIKEKDEEIISLKGTITLLQKKLKDADMTFNHIKDEKELDIKKENFYETLKKARSYEKSLNYERAAELYEELEMWDDARRCREHSKKKEIKRHINIPEEEEKIDLTGIGDFFSYRIGKKIGQGGFSKVYVVKDEDGNEFAMKIPLDVNLNENETLDLPDKVLQSFIKEARIWNTLTENKIPGIVELYGFGVHPFPWFVMEYMPDGSLRKRIGKDGMDEKDAVEIAVKVLNTLYYIHHYGIVHRDIKPENVLLKGDEVKLTDFGLGKALGKASKSSQGFSGTIEYSAPEQLSKRKYGNVDWRTDIYQVGAMLYEMLSGRPPFEGDDLGEVTTAILMEEPEAIDGIDEGLNGIVMKALSKKKEDRWQGAMEFKKKLEELNV